MQSEIGSNFWLNPFAELRESELYSPEQFGCRGNDHVWLSTGRSAIKYVLKTIGEREPEVKKVALLPPFTCHTVVEPFIDAGYQVYHYPVDKGLKTSSIEILDCAGKCGAAVVLFHRYFGFDTIHGVGQLCAELRKRDIYSIEDCTQCLYSELEKSEADFCVGSIRKWTGVPDGGFAVCREGLFSDKPIEPNWDLEKAKVGASYAKYRFLFEQEGEKADFLKQYREAENILAGQEIFHAPTEMTKRVQASLDLKELKEKRRKNYETLLAGLSDTEMLFILFPALPDGVIPLYFPVIAENRAGFQTHLAQHSIFAPIVWPKAECIGAICNEAEFLYEHQLCIPIDQRYDEDDMSRIVETIKQYSE